MKKLLFPLLLLASSSFAQHLELGLNGGAAMYSGFNTGFISTPSSVTAPLVSLKAMYVAAHYQYGISADYRRLSYTLTEEIWGDLYSVPPGGQFTPQPYYLHSHLVNKQYPLRAFVNRTVSIGHAQLYAGVFAGYIFSLWQQESEGEYRMPVNGGWVYSGIQAGATYALTKHIGINAELEGDYNFDSKSFDGSYLANLPGNRNKYVYPASVGVRYKL